jgi:hypothetical protein
MVPPFTNRCLSRHLTWSASGDKQETKAGLGCSALGGIPPAPQKEGGEEVVFFINISILNSISWKGLWGLDIVGSG